MRYVFIVLCLILLSTPAFPNEQLDIEAVEQHLQLEKEALQIYKRAEKRAENAVKKSSLGRELLRLHEVPNDETKKITKSKLGLNFDKLRKSIANSINAHRLREKYAKFVRIMTYKFLDDEIKELREKKRNALLRIFEELRHPDIEHELSALNEELSYLEAEVEFLKAR